MNIRLTDGVVLFDAGSIGPHCTRSQFLSSSFGVASDVLVKNEPHITYRFRPENGIVATVSFVGDRLLDVAWILELPPDKEREWSVDLEQDRKKLHDEWLERLLGRPPYEYDWGTITSSYDSKGCHSDIILRYAS